MISNIVEMEAADALLDVGVSLPLIRFRFGKKERSIRVNMKRPVLGNQIRIAKLYLEMGITYEEIKQFNKHEELAFLAAHGKRISKMVALTICRGPVSSKLFSGLLAWYLRWFVANRYLLAANLCFITLLGTKDFMNIIESAQISNPMKPRASRKQKRS